MSEGTPTVLNWIVRYNAVQEQGTTNWSAGSAGPSVKMLSSSPTVRTRFTGWSLPAGVNDHFNDTTHSTSMAVFTDCQFGGGKFTADPGSVALTNCLWERVFVTLKDNAYDMQWFLFNNLIHGGTLSYRAIGDSPVLLAYDNLFEGTIIAKGISSDSFTHDNNGYLTNQNRLTPNGAHDIILTSVAYATGSLGSFYQPANSQLFDKGSSPADDIGLYHYTITTNQVKETNSIVDIGFHYVAVDTNGVAFDTNGNGIPDYSDPQSTPRTDIVWSNGVWQWKANSLAWNCWTNALACKDAAQGSFSNILTGIPPTGLANQRNTNFWFRHYTGWPAYSVWNNCSTNEWPTNINQTCSGGYTWHGAGVLVSPEHVLTTGHVGFGTNQWLAFVDMTNNVVFRQVKDYFYKSALGGETTNNLTSNMPTPPFYDYYIGLLDEPVPDSIGYVRVIPTNWWAWFDAPFYNNATNHTFHVPLYIQTCQHRTPVMKDLVSLTCSSGYRYETFGLLSLTNWDHNTVQGGDSGSPWFFTLDGELCLADIISSSLGSALLDSTGLRYEVTDPAFMQASVNAAMRELSLRNSRTNIYSLTVKDLSKYPIYRDSYNCSP